mgnify:CR=1 FL=1
MPHENCLAHFLWLINGEEEIVKLPWKPKKGDTYFSFELLGDTWIVASSIWGGFPNEYALLDKGWIFRTCAEAGAALPAVALLAAGWELECTDCGEINSEDNGLPTYKDNKAYCGKCGAELDFAEDNILRKIPLKK